MVATVEMIARYPITDWSSEDKDSRNVCLHIDDIFESGSEVSLTVESEWEIEKKKSFWRRAFSLTLWGSNTLSREGTVRGESPLWIDDDGFGVNDVKFTLLFISVCCIWHVLLYVVSLFSHLHNEFTGAKCSHESSVKIWEIVVARVMLRPLFHCFALYAQTNLRGFRGRKFWLKSAVVWIVFTSYSTTYQSMWALYVCTGLGNSLVLNICSLLLRIILMLLLVRCLRLEWRANFCWLMVIWGWTYSFLIVCKVRWVSLGASESESIRTTTKSIFVWMPILTMVYEWGTQTLIKRCYEKFQDNDIGISWVLLITLFNPELLRFLSFMLVYLDQSPGDLILNMLCSLIGEIWTHTQVSRLCRNAVFIRLYGTTADSFPKLYKLIGASRSHLEYIAPVWFISSLSCEIIWGLRPGLNQVYKKKWFILGAYFAQEFVAEVICRVIRKSSGYERLSALGHFKFNIQLMIVLLFLVSYDIVGCLDTLEVLLA